MLFRIVCGTALKVIATGEQACLSDEMFALQKAQMLHSQQDSSTAAQEQSVQASALQERATEGKKQDPFDGTTQKKSRPVTETYYEMDGGLETKVTKTVNGQYSHEFRRNEKGVETTTRNKRGYEHKHKHSHNGDGGNSRTETSSKRGSWEHKHTHDHKYNPNTGETETNTETVSKGDGIVDLTHTHNHEHRHVPGVGTRSHTDSMTDTNAGTHTHSHDHYYNEVTGDQDSESNSNAAGPKWDNIFSGDD